MPKTAAFTDPVSAWEIHFNIIANFLFIAFFSCKYYPLHLIHVAQLNQKQWNGMNTKTGARKNELSTFLSS